MKIRSLLGAAILVHALLGCGGGGQLDYEGGRYPVLGSPFPTTLLIPDTGAGNQALAQTASQPLIGAFRFYLDIPVPAPMKMEFFSMESVLQGVPDGMALAEASDAAFVTVSGQAEGVYVFRPSEGFRFLESFLYTGAAFPLPRPAPDSRGTELSEVQPRYTSGAALLDDKLYLTTSNYIRAGIDPVCAPGTVWVVGYGGAQPGFHSPVPQGTILTGGFNPSEVTPFTFTDESRDPSRTYRALLVTNTGVLDLRGGTGTALTDGSVDVVDPELDCVVASYPLGRGAPAFSAIGVARQTPAVGGTVYRGYLGSAGYNHVYELDLTGLAAYLGVCPEPDSVPRLGDKVLAGPDDPIRATLQPQGTASEVAQVVVNFDGTRAYATGFNSGTLAVLELSTRAERVDHPDGSVNYTLEPSRKEPLDVIQVTDPMPSLNETSPGPVAVRPGVPGEGYQGPDVFVLTGIPNGELRWVRSY